MNLVGSFQFNQSYGYKESVYFTVCDHNIYLLGMQDCAEVLSHPSFLYIWERCHLANLSLFSLCSVLKNGFLTPFNENNFL